VTKGENSFDAHFIDNLFHLSPILGILGGKRLSICPAISALPPDLPLKAATCSFNPPHKSGILLSIMNMSGPRIRSGDDPRQPGAQCEPRPRHEGGRRTSPGCTYTSWCLSLFLNGDILSTNWTSLAPMQLHQCCTSSIIPSRRYEMTPLRPRPSAPRLSARPGRVVRRAGLGPHRLTSTTDNYFIINVHHMSDELALPWRVKWTDF